MSTVYQDNIEPNYVWAVINRPEDFDPMIKPEFFDSPVLKSIWAKLTSLRESGVTQWDLNLLYSEFKRSEDRTWLAQNCNIPTFKALIPFYKENIIKKYQSRLVQQLTNEMLVDKSEIDPHAFQQKLSEKLLSTRPKQKSKDGGQIAKEIFDYLEKAKEQGGLTGINCGFRVFNELFNGFQPGRLYVLAARPSMGKSALTLNFALSASISQARTYIHCLEESLLSFSSRILSNLSLVDNEAIQRGRFSDSQWAPIAEAATKLAKLPIHINDKANITAREIIDEIKITHSEHPVDIVFVDHIQDIARTKDSWHHDISESCGLFKALAKDLNIPVVIVSQLNRGVEQRADKRPVLSDLKESGDIEAKADVVFLMYRDEYYHPDTIDKGIVEIKVSKNRDGRIGMIRLGWDPKHMKFRETF